MGAPVLSCFVNAAAQSPLTAPRFYTFTDDEFCRLVFEFRAGRVFLHCRPRAEGYRVAWRLWGLIPAIRAALKALEAPAKVEVYFRQTDGWGRLLRRFGFVTRAQRRGWVLMEAFDAPRSRRIDGL